VVIEEEVEEVDLEVVVEVVEEVDLRKEEIETFPLPLDSFFSFLFFFLFLFIKKTPKTFSNHLNHL
jgi:hypothetical protein